MSSLRDWKEIDYRKPRKKPERKNLAGSEWKDILKPLMLSGAQVGLKKASEHYCEQRLKLKTPPDGIRITQHLSSDAPSIRFCPRKHWSFVNNEKVFE